MNLFQQPTPPRSVVTRGRRLRCLVAAGLACASFSAAAQSTAERKLDEATELIGAFTDNGPDSIPAELLDRALGIAIIPKVFRGGFILGARRGRGILSIRMDDGSWSNPAFVTLTGGSIGWQIGAESTDVVLVFANQSAIKNIESGKFTLGGEATAVAGPLRKQASSTMTFRAEVYGYLRSRGLYAGAAFQGARLDIDEDLAAELYGSDSAVRPLTPAGASSPPSVRALLATLNQGPRSGDTTVSGASGNTPASGASGDSELKTFPLPD